MADQQVTQQSTISQTSEEVFEVISKATYFLVFTVPDPQSLSTPTLLIQNVPLTTYKISIVEAPRRFAASVQPPTPECGFRASKSISKRQVANQRLNLQVTPNNFESGPGRTPPPTLLFPFISQRFWMDNGNFDFLDGLGVSSLSNPSDRWGLGLFLSPVLPTSSKVWGSWRVSSAISLLVASPYHQPHSRITLFFAS